MTTSTESAGIGFTRCAVCKIDLKGRFVYIDEAVEEMLGLTREDLFGKPIADYLDATSQELIDQLLAHRNHYETFYDTTALRILGRDKRMRTFRVVSSLNFIAGNPVNYQLIIDRDGPEPADVSLSRPGSDWPALITDMLGALRIGSSDRLVLRLAREAGAGEVVLYEIADDHSLVIAIAATRAGGFEPERRSLSATPNDFLLRLAETGDSFAFTDQDQVRRTIEQFGLAPNEIVVPWTAADGHRQLLRLMFDEGMDHRDATTAFFVIDSTCQVWERLVSGNGAPDQSQEIKFTIGFLDSIGIAAFLTDNTGAIIGYNPSLLGIFDEHGLQLTYADFLRQLTDWNRTDFEQPIIEHLTRDHSEEALSLDYHLRVRVSATRQYDLTVMKLNESGADVSACFIFLPVRGEGVVTDAESLSYRFSYELSRRARRWIDDTHGRMLDLSARAAAANNDDISAIARDLLASLEAGRATLGDAVTVRRLSRIQHHRQSLELGRLIDDVLQQIWTERQCDRLEVHHVDLPRIVANERVLRWSLYQVLHSLACLVTDGTARFECTASLSSGNAWLVFRHDGSVLKEDSVRRQLFGETPPEPTAPNSSAMQPLLPAVIALVPLHVATSLKGDQSGGFELTLCHPVSP